MVSDFWRRFTNLCVTYTHPQSCILRDTLNKYNSQHTTMYELEKYWIAHGAMVFLGAWIPSVVLFFCSLCLVRRKRDPARTAFTYLKLALLVFSGYAPILYYLFGEVE